MFSRIFWSVMVSFSSVSLLSAAVVTLDFESYPTADFYTVGWWDDEPSATPRSVSSLPDGYSADVATHLNSPAGYFWANLSVGSSHFTDYSGGGGAYDSDGLGSAKVTYSPAETTNVTLYSTSDTGYPCTGGFGISRNTDITTVGYTNQTSVYASSGADGSDTFLIGYDCLQGMGGSDSPELEGYTTPTLEFSQPLDLISVDIANSTYAVLSMNGGDSFGKVFSYADKDWFKLTISGMDEENKIIDSCDYYLADFLTEDSPGIIEGWNTVELNFTEKISGLRFTMSSSDVGTYGMNTPAYFALDNLRWNEGSAPENVPEPAPWFLMLSGFTWLALRYRIFRT